MSCSTPSGATSRCHCQAEPVLHCVSLASDWPWPCQKCICDILGLVTCSMTCRLQLAAKVQASRTVQGSPKAVAPLTLKTGHSCPHMLIPDHTPRLNFCSRASLLSVYIPAVQGTFTAGHETLMRQPACAACWHHDMGLCTDETRWAPRANIPPRPLHPQPHLPCRSPSCASRWSACTAWPSGRGARCRAS